MADLAIHTLVDGESAKYLGKPVGFLHEHMAASRAEEILGMAVSLLTLILSYWQKLDAMKTFFYPAMVFSNRLSIQKKTVLNEVDGKVRPLLKRMFNLPPNAANNFLYSAYNKGGAGIPLLGGGRPLRGRYGFQAVDLPRRLLQDQS